MTSPGPAAARLSSTDQWWRPRTFNTNYVCAAENYSPRTFAACCNGPVTNSVVPIEAKAAVLPGGVCAAYCYVDDTRMASNERNPRGYSDYYMCLVEMSGERGRSGLKTVHGEWIAVDNGERNSTEDVDAVARHRDHHHSPIPVSVPLDLDSDTGELIFPSPYADDDEDRDELRKRSSTDETLASAADPGSSNKHETGDAADTNNPDPKLANPDDAAQNDQTIAPDRPLSYSYTYSTTSTPLANSTTATPTIETGFTTAPGPTSGVNTTSTLPTTQTGTGTVAPHAGQPTGTSAAAATAGRLKQNSGTWGAGKWGCVVAALVGVWAAVS